MALITKITLSIILLTMFLYSCTLAKWTVFYSYFKNGAKTFVL